MSIPVHLPCLVAEEAALLCRMDSEMLKCSWEGVENAHKRLLFISHEYLIRKLTELIQAQINGVMFNITWSIAPVLVSVISFSTFVYTGHRLTVSLAFTAVQIFSMIKM